MSFRVGIGFDVHRLVSNRDLILGGVKIEHSKGLLGHSDADVLTHAVMDSLLGAAGLPDIGVYFPDSDERWKGKSSLEMLFVVSETIRDNGFSVCNVDATVICETPKLRPFIEEMKSNIAACLGVDSFCINVKATTTEKLGFTGKEEGIAAQAVCMLSC